jgi:dTDP-4-amino-4,6-dideoxygalactose transaminase
MPRSCGLSFRRRSIWDRYHRAFEALEQEGYARRPIVPRDCLGNAHMYHLLLGSAGATGSFLERLKARGVQAVFHYVPLHSSPAGRRYGRAHGPMTNTDELSGRIVRLPLWLGLEDKLDRVIEIVIEELRSIGRSGPASREKS